MQAGGSQHHGHTIHRRCALPRIGGASSPQWGSNLTGITTVVPAAWPSAVFWGYAPKCAEPVLGEPAEPISVTLVSGDAAFRAALQERLVEAGYGVTFAQSPDLYAATAAGGTSPSEVERRQIVLFLAEKPGDGDLIEQVSQQIAALARTATMAAERHAVLWVVTCEAQQATLRAPSLRSGRRCSVESRARARQRNAAPLGSSA